MIFFNSFVAKLSLLIALVFSIASPKVAFAQLAEPEIPADSVAFGFVPAFAYNSDFGFLVGGIVNRYDYRGGKPPFKTYVNSYGVISTKGLFRISTRFDQVQTFNSPVRSLWEGYAFRAFQDYYFGIGNDTPFELKTFAEQDTYFFKSQGWGFNYRGRYALWRGKGISRFDVLFGGNLSYQTPFDNENDRLIAQDRPVGYDGGYVNYVSLGVMLENRDSEFRPTRGHFLFAEMQAGHKTLGSSFNMAGPSAMASGYTNFHLLLDVVAAARVGWMQSWGDVPYWMLPKLGGDGNLRGFPVNRFTDNTALYYNAELRTWLWDFENGLIRIGGQLFFDGGRVFPSGVPKGVFDDHHFVLGFGGAMSAFTPDFFLRGDVGFSDELYRIYISVGYAF